MTLSAKAVQELTTENDSLRQRLAAAELQRDEALTTLKRIADCITFAVTGKKVDGGGG